MNVIIRCVAGIALFALGACQAVQLSTPANDAKRQTYLQQQIELSQLRAQMRPLARQVAVRVPIDCDLALAGITDPTMRATLLDLAANAGIYTVVRVDSADPRVGLADLLVTVTTVTEALIVAEQTGPFPTLAPVIAAFSEFQGDLDELAKEWLSEEARAQLAENIAEAKAAGVQKTAGLQRVASLLAVKPEVPASLQIESSFISFDDGGLIERGIGELHQTRIAVKQAADVAALLPQALEYRMKRVMEATLAEAKIAEMRADLSSIADDMKKLDSLKGLESLKSLESLAALDGLSSLKGLSALDNLDRLTALDKLGGLERLEKLESLATLEALQPLSVLRDARLLIAAALLGGLILQGVLLAWAIRRR